MATYNYGTYSYGLDAFPILKEETPRCALKTSPRTAPGH